MDYPWLIAGRKVECISSQGWQDTEGRIVGPKLGDVCTIRDVMVMRHPRVKGEIAVVLEEYPAHCLCLLNNSGIPTFRPLEDKDKEIFEQWLKDIPLSLQDEFPEHPLQPTTPKERERV